MEKERTENSSIAIKTAETEISIDSKRISISAKTINLESCKQNQKF